MAENRKSEALQVEEDRPWQEALWTAQRLGWAVMAAIILFALLGLTGNGGPLSSASARVGGSTVEYPRITRWESDEQIAVRLPPSASGKVDVELSRSFAELFQVRSIQPEPAEVVAASSGYRYSFDVGGTGDKVVVFHVRASEPALRRDVQLRVADAPAGRLPITVLP